VGVLLSAGGSAFHEAVRLSGLPADRFHVVTDRACGAEEKARDAGISCDRIVEADRDRFSAAVSERMGGADCRVVLLHFSRLVTEALFGSRLTFNVHPSLLPAFPGLDGVGDAARARSLYQGATLHLVDGGMDTGPVVSQTCCAVPVSADVAWRQHLAFRQKVLVTLSLFDLLAAGRIDTSRKGMDAVDTAGLAPGPFLNPGLVDSGLETAAAAFAGPAYGLMQGRGL
jgi:phosphoribosylglycinamide formyltransferase-1